MRESMGSGGCALAATVGFQRRIAAAVAALGASVGGSGALGQVVYVDDDAAPGGDGRSWESAVRTIQEAMEIARGAPVWEREIRIAEGVYFVVPPGGDPAIAFEPTSGMVFRGGFGRSLTADRNSGEWVQDPGRYATVVDGAAGVPGAFDDAQYLIRTRPDAYEHVQVEGIRFRNARDGAIWLGPSGSMSVVDCQFEGFGVTASVVAGTEALALWLERCRFIGNHSRDSVVEAWEVAHVVALDCVFEGNVPSGIARDGAAMRVRSSETVLLAGCRFEGNGSGGEGGAVEIGWTLESVQVVGCTFEGNWAGGDGGALRVPGGAEQTWITHSVFRSNRAGALGGGGALGMEWWDTARVEHCLFESNSAGLGAGAVDAERAWVANCTFVGNHTDGVGGGGLVVGWGGRLSNSIVWGNTAGQAASRFEEQVVIDGGRVEDNVIEGAAGGTNLGLDPLFAGPRDYRLGVGSPAINLGNRGNVLEWPQVDLAGRERISGLFIDAGCYEADSPAGCGEADIATQPVRGVAGYRIPDGRVTSDDFYAYLEAYVSGNASADLTRTTIKFDPYYGVPDGIISHTDLCYYLIVYEEGCE